MKTAIAWFRNDLRVRDNAMLAEAAKADRVYAVYCFDPRHFRQLDLGFPKTGPFRTRFLIESIRDLRKNLQHLGNNLIVRVGYPEDILPKLARQINAEVIYCSQEVTDEELKAENAVESFLMGGQTRLSRIWQSTLYHKDDIPWPIHRLPEIFTNFRKQAEKESDIRSIIPTPKFKDKPDIDEGEIPTLGMLGVSEHVTDSRAVMKFVGGEKYAWKRLKDYFWEKDLLKKYKETRNGLLGEDYSSKFSPWLAHGCISPRSIYWEVKKYEKERIRNRSTYWLIFELIWRDYFRFVAKKHGNHIFKLSGIRQKQINLDQNMQEFENWTNGTTGVPFVDANMIELKKTGFMSNRGRQNVASFLRHDLKTNWTWGASYFESFLIDYDPASNWGNWNYVAGVGNDPREDRYFNIESQASRYDPKGTYVKYWLENDEELSLF